MTPLLATLVAVALAGTPPEWARLQDKGQASLWVEKRFAPGLRLKLSESLDLLIRVDGPEPLEVELTQKLRSDTGWQLAAVGPPSLQPSDAPGMQRWQWRLRLTPLAPGVHAVRVPGLQIVAKNGQETVIAWDAVAIDVTTRVAKVDVSEVRDPTGIEELPPPPAAEPPSWPWIIGGALLAVGLLTLWRWLPRRMRLLPSAADVARGELQALAASPGDSLALHTRLSDIVRRYLEARWQLPATRRTTPEFFAALLQASVLPEAEQGELRAVLERCDLAKFAPVQIEGTQAIASALAFVDRTAVLAEQTDVLGPKKSRA